jgi:small subunit ribosomal protein S6e
MKLNIAYPATGSQKVIEIEDENRLRAFFDKRISAEVGGEVLGEEFNGYVFRISGGNDKQGFAMKQGILTTQRVRILFHDGMSCFRIRKRGERKRKSIRGCIVSADLSVLNLVIVKKGDAEIEGVTNVNKPRRLGPKRATRIRRLFNLDKNDDVRKYVIRRKIEKTGAKKPIFKAPKIQRLVTPRRLQHKRQQVAVKRQRYEKTRTESAAFQELVAARFKEAREARFAKVQKRRSLSRKASEKPTETSAPATTKAAPVQAAPKAKATTATPKPVAAKTTAPTPAATKPAASKPAATKPAKKQ